MTEQASCMPGQVIQDRYRIDMALATGGQAHVYRGYQIELEREVAIKLLKNHGTEEVKERMARRFEQEARLISRLKDPHTITLYDFGKLPDGALFMVFEYVDGISLKELIASQGKVEPYRVAKILRQTLSSLHEAHALGVLHRDLKPANIMIYEHAGRRDQIKLLDFGIAKILREEVELPRANLTGDRIVGTPRYLAPELLLKEAPNAASDLYSLGMVGYELLVGRPAIKARSSLEIVAKQIDEQSFSLPEQLDVPQELRRIIDKLLKKNREERYKEVLDVSLDLKRWMRRSVPQDEDSEVFDADLTPADDIPAAREYRKRTQSKSRLSVVVPEALQSDIPDMATPRTTFARSVVFKGKPDAEHVDSLISSSMRTHAREQTAITSVAQGERALLQGTSATKTTSDAAIPPPTTTTQPIHMTSALSASPALSPEQIHLLDARRGGDTVAIESISPAATSQEWEPRPHDPHQKIVIAVILGLVLSILFTAVALYLLVLN